MKTHIFDIENWKEIGSTLARNKTRTFLTGFGIFWGVAMLAILLGGASGAKDMLMRNFAGFATNSAFTYANWTTIPYKGHQKGRNWNLDITDVERLRQAIPELRTVTEQYNNSGVSFSSGKFSYSGSVIGATPQFADVMTPVIYSGRFVNQKDVSQGRRVAVVGQKIVNEIFPNDPAPLGRDMQINGITYTIIGVAGQTSEVTLSSRIDESVIIPSSVFRRAFNRGNNVDMIMMVARDGKKISDIEQKLRHLVAQHHNISPDDKYAIEVIDISENFKMVDNLFKGVSFLAGFIGLSTLLAGIIGIGNIMWVIVKERTQEIGIRRAIGAKPRDITAQILSEGMMLTTVAGLAGICFAAIALGIAQYLTTDNLGTPRFQMQPGQALIIMLTFVTLGTLAGLIPARKAMNIKPVEAINDK